MLTRRDRALRSFIHFLWRNKSWNRRRTSLLRWLYFHSRKLKREVSWSGDQTTLKSGEWVGGGGVVGAARNRTTFEIHRCRCGFGEGEQLWNYQLIKANKVDWWRKRRDARRLSATCKMPCLSEMFDACQISMRELLNCAGRETKSMTEVKKRSAFERKKKNDQWITKNIHFITLNLISSLLYHLN